MRREVFIGTEKTGNKEHVTITDIETGEIINSFWRERRKAPSGRPAEGKKPHFYRVYCSNWNDIIDKKRLSFAEIGVLMSLMRFVDWESNFLIHPRTGNNLNASEIAKLLKKDRGSLDEHIKRLYDKGLVSIVKCGGSGYENHYILNSHILFKGNKMKDLNEHQRFSKDCPYQPPVPIRYKQHLDAYFPFT